MNQTDIRCHIRSVRAKGEGCQLRTPDMYRSLDYNSRQHEVGSVEVVKFFSRIGWLAKIDAHPFFGIYAMLLCNDCNFIHISAGF